MSYLTPGNFRDNAVLMTRLKAVLHTLSYDEDFNDKLKNLSSKCGAGSHPFERPDEYNYFTEGSNPEFKEFMDLVFDYLRKTSVKAHADASDEADVKPDGVPAGNDMPEVNEETDNWYYNHPIFQAALSEYAYECREVYSRKIKDLGLTDDKKEVKGYYEKVINSKNIVEAIYRKET